MLNGNERHKPHKKLTRKKPSKFPALVRQTFSAPGAPRPWMQCEPHVPQGDNLFPSWISLSSPSPRRWLARPRKWRDPRASVGRRKCETLIGCCRTSPCGRISGSGWGCHGRSHALLTDSTSWQWNLKLLRKLNIFCFSRVDCLIDIEFWVLGKCSPGVAFIEEIKFSWWLATSLHLWIFAIAQQVRLPFMLTLSWQPHGEITLKALIESLHMAKRNNHMSWIVADVIFFTCENQELEMRFIITSMNK